MNTHTTLGRRIVAALGAAALGLVGLAGVAGAAAVDTAPTDPKAQETGSLTIHKVDGPTTGNTNNGTEQQNVAGTPLDGVTFTVRPVTKIGDSEINLTTAAGWKLIQGVDDHVADVAAGNGYTLGDATSVMTGAAGNPGEAKFDDLPIGLYLVQETGHGSLPIVTTAAPFLVTIPLAENNAQGEATGNWLYDVHAYPKNQLVDKPTKQVADPTSVLAAGAIVTWTVNAPIPALNGTDSFTKFVVTDDLDPKLEYQASATVTVEDLTLETTDYSVSTGNPVTVTFSPSGLTKLEGLAQRPGYDGTTNVVVKINTKVLEGGSIENTANVNVNDNEQDTNTPSTQWGYIKIVKQDKDTQAKLAGAEFAVYKTEDDATAGTDAIATATTGDDGTLTFGPLWVGNDNEAASKDYFVKELTAPKGYVLDPALHTVKVTPSAPSAVEVTQIDNTKAEVPNLPLTGANGQMLALIGGGALVLLAGGTALVARKRSHQD